MADCPVCGKFFETNKGMLLYKRFHDNEYLTKLREGVQRKWKNEEYRKFRSNLVSGEKNPKFGKENKWGHHSENAKKRISNSRIGNANPAKRLDVRNKISEALKGHKTWNKGIAWNRPKFHDSEMEKIAKDFTQEGFKILTTHRYVPDAIVIDFKNKLVKAFELNPHSVIDIEERAKNKGYDDIIVKVKKPWKC